MSKYLLRIEAVNLGNFTEDTQDLSTIRGGSLLLLQAAEGLKNQAHSIVKLTEVTSGASAGLYEFEADDDFAASHMRDRIEESLRQKSGLRFATIMVDVQPAEAQFAEDLQALTAQNRWRQMQTPSVILDSNSSDKLCEIDKVRPAISQEFIKGRNRWVSQAVLDRREHGREMKQELYQEQIKMHVLAQFVHDLGELADDSSKGNLHNKIAIIYLDGNRFGKIKEQAGNDRTVWEGFDQTVKTYRRQMLDSLLDIMSSGGDWQTKQGRYRIETLLWGGDEIIWVVPAWKGWETLKHFYQCSESWKFNGESLRHAAGMVFCHHNAPIHRLTKLARDLAEQAKRGDGRDHNRFAYEVLESFDHIGSDFESYRQTRCVQPLKANEESDLKSLVLDAKEIEFLQDQAQRLREKLPRRKLHDVVESLLTPSVKRAAAINDLKGRLRTADVSESQLLELEQRLGNEVCWLHLHNLWDYIV